MIPSSKEPPKRLASVVARLPHERRIPLLTPFTMDETLKMAASAVSKHRDKNLRRHSQRRVHFKNPLVEEDLVAEDDSTVEEESVNSSCRNNSMKARVRERIDPLFQRHAKEMIAARLVEGYYLKGNGEKCKECFMPLMVKDNAWDGVFCGQGWYQSNKKGVCVVCNPESGSIMEYEDDDDESYESLDLFVKRGIHWIPRLPDDEQSQDGSVVEFQKKYLVHSEVHVNIDELRDDVEHEAIAVKESNVVLQPKDSKSCPDCGMEMLNFGKHMECPFCALEVVKKELGIAATDPVPGHKAELQSEHGSESGARTESKTESVADNTENVEEKKTATATRNYLLNLDTGANAEEDDTKAKDDTVERIHQVDYADSVSTKKMSSKKDDGSVAGLYLEELEAPSSSCSTLSASVRFAEARPVSPTLVAAIHAAIHSTPEKSVPTQNECKEAPTAKTHLDPGSTQLAVTSILKRLITGFWQENNEKSAKEPGSTKGESLNGDDKPIKDDESTGRELQDRVKSFATKVFPTEEGDSKLVDASASTEIKVLPSDHDVAERNVAERSIQENTRECVEPQNAHEPAESSWSNVNCQSASNNPQKPQGADSEANASATDPTKLQAPGDPTVDVNVSNDFLRVESTSFDKDMSTNEILSALSEINSVTRSMLTKQDQPVINTIPEHLPFVEEGAIRSSIDPPSVCSRDPPHLAANINDLKGDLLLLHNDYVSPDSRDPPTTVPDENYQHRLEFSFPDALECTVPDRNPRDPSEHGGSIDMDSFSQVDETDSTPVYHSNTVEEVLAKYESTRISTQKMEVSSTLGSNKTSMECNSKSTPSKVVYQQPDIIKRLNHSVAESQNREPVKPASPPVPQRAVKVAPLRAADLYQQPAFLKALRNEHESPRDIMVRSRLMELESRYQKLTSPHAETSQEVSQTQFSAPVVQLSSNTGSIFRGSHFSFDTMDLHQTTSISDVSSWKVKENGPGLSPAAVQRREHYKKELCDKEFLKLQSSNSAYLSLSPTAVQRRKTTQEASQTQFSAPIVQLMSNRDRSHFSFDTMDLHQTTSISDVLSWKVKRNGPGLSPTAVQRHEQYKKELCNKEHLKSQNSNSADLCLSPTAVQRRNHYKEVLKRQMSEQGSNLASQE